MEKFPPGFLAGMSSLNDYFTKQPRLDVYEDKKEPIKKWRWRIFMSSDEVAASTQGYATKAACIENLKKIGKHIIELERTGKLV